jgi:3-isopropylmalate/(R)-2-methylmalate dehydratase small subunit
MQPFARLTAVAAPLEVAKIDTGMILPGRYMRRHRRPGHDYAEAFLHDLRFDQDETPRPDFPLNQPAYRDARILVTDADFGCGSSREGAAYAVLDFGLRALVGPSFGDIFFGNCMLNGILPVVLPDRAIKELWQQLRERPGAEMTIDLEQQVVIAPKGNSYGFDINPVRKDRLLRGVDDIDFTLAHEGQIAAFEANRNRRFPWLPKAQRET